MEETKELKALYGAFQAFIYLSVIIEIFTFIYFNLNSEVYISIHGKFAHLPIYQNIFYSKLFTFSFIILTSIGTKAKKNLDFNVYKHFYFPFVVGFILMFGSVFFLSLNAPQSTIGINFYSSSYMITSILGALFINIAFDNLSKKIKNSFMKDQFNVENETFEQSRKLVENNYSVNIPMLFRWKKKLYKGWINIVNPFRGTLLIGTPGSGKSFSVVNSFIRQHSAKGFAMVVYDFKYPALGKILYYNYLLNKQKGNINSAFKFNVINFDNVEYSRRVNPLRRDYIKVLADAMETSEALYESLEKGIENTGNSKFFKTSAINFLACCIYFFSKYEKGIHSDLPHVLAFINRSYKEIFDVLFSEPELQSLLSPFKTAYENKAFEQLEGQIGSLKVQISKLATKESFWIFSGDDFDLKVSDPKTPSYLLIANNPKTMGMNSALNALVINRLTRLINTENNLPTSIIVDESPTLYFHQIANLLSTARENQVAVLLGLQEIPQLEEQYGKAVAKTVTSVIGNILSGSARSKETLEWLQTVFGRSKQKKEGVSIDRHRTTVSINEQMDYIIPASKIANLQAGSLVGQIALDFGQEKDFKTTMYNCKTNLDLNSIKKEETNYVDLPKFYNFGSLEEKEKKLTQNFLKIYREVDVIVRKYV